MDEKKIISNVILFGLSAFMLAAFSYLILKYKSISLKDNFIEISDFFSRKKNIHFNQIKSISIIMLPKSNGRSYFTLKFILNDEGSLVLDTPLHPGFFSNTFVASLISKDYDDTTYLPSTEKIKQIISQNPNIQMDKFIMSYMESGKTNLYYEYLKGIEKNMNDNIAKPSF